MATKLAALAGCSPEELIITRNATESLDMIIGGLNWNQGDEAVMAEQDYGNMFDIPVPEIYFSCFELINFFIKVCA